MSEERIDQLCTQIQETGQAVGLPEYLLAAAKTIGVKTFQLEDLGVVLYRLTVSADGTVEALRATLARAAYVAEHLHAMIDRDTWRASGGDDGQGHYEGDYRAEQVACEIVSWRTAGRVAPGAGETQA